MVTQIHKKLKFMKHLEWCQHLYSKVHKKWARPEPPRVHGPFLITDFPYKQKSETLTELVHSLPFFTFLFCVCTKSHCSVFLVLNFLWMVPWHRFYSYVCFSHLILCPGNNWCNAAIVHFHGFHCIVCLFLDLLHCIPFTTGEYLFLSFSLLGDRGCGFLLFPFFSCLWFVETV